MIKPSAMKPTPDFEWADYFEATDKAKLNPLYAQLDPYLAPGLTALDLGCGVGHGTVHLCSRGLQVTAVDVSADAINRLQRRMPPGNTIQVIEADFRNLVFPTDAFDIVTATNALYFLPPDEFPGFWQRLVGWLRTGGIIIGQFMGPRDSWADREDYNVQSSEQVQRLFSRGFELLHFHDDERDSVNLLGTKTHVHVTHVVARKF